MYTDSIAITLATLIKNNNGKFLNKKQKEFIEKHCIEECVYVTSIPKNKKNFEYITFILDEIGVVKVEKDSGLN